MKIMKEIQFQNLTIDAQGLVIERSDRTVQAHEIDLGGGVSLEMVAIPGGFYQMGSPGAGGYEDEHPLHLANIPPFFLGRSPVTQA